MQGNRAADWNVWSHVPNPRLWEAVVLSLNIDPRQVRHTKDQWMASPGADRMFDESPELSDRMLVARSNVSSEGPLHPISISMGQPLECKVSLSEFGAWAETLDWQLPNAFPRSRGKQPSPHRDDAERPLMTKERNTLLAIIGVLANMAGLDIKKASKTGEIIESEAAKLGLSLSRRSAMDHLSRVPDAMATKGK